MDGRGSRLAARFRKAVQDEQSARRDAEQEARRRLEEARAAREALLAELATLVREIGVVEVRPGPDGLTLRYRERHVHLAPKGDQDRIDVEFDGQGDEQHWLYRQAELGGRWVYARKRRHRDDRLPLYDAGLEELLVRGLGLPPPAADAPAEDPKDRKL